MIFAFLFFSGKDGQLLLISWDMGNATIQFALESKGSAVNFSHTDFSVDTISGLQIFSYVQIICIVDNFKFIQIK